MLKGLVSTLFVFNRITVEKKLSVYCCRCMESGSGKVCFGHGICHYGGEAKCICFHGYEGSLCNHCAHGFFKSYGTCLPRQKLLIQTGLRCPQQLQYLQFLLKKMSDKPHSSIDFCGRMPSDMIAYVGNMHSYLTKYLSPTESQEWWCCLILNYVTQLSLIAHLL